MPKECFKLTSCGDFIHRFIDENHPSYSHHRSKEWLKYLTKYKMDHPDFTVVEDAWHRRDDVGTAKVLWQNYRSDLNDDERKTLSEDDVLDWIKVLTSVGDNDTMPIVWRAFIKYAGDTMKLPKYEKYQLELATTLLQLSSIKFHPPKAIRKGWLHSNEVGMITIIGEILGVEPSMKTHALLTKSFGTLFLNFKNSLKIVT